MPEKDDAKPDPTEEKDKPEVVFKTKGEYLHLLDQEVKKRVEKATKETAAKARADVLASLELDDDEDLGEVKTRLATSKKAKGEVEVLTAAQKKLESKLRESEKTISELSGFKDQTLRAKALSPHATKFRDPEDMQVHLSSRLVLAEDGTAAAPDGTDLGAYIDKFLEAKPHLRAAEFKPGTGTGKVPPKGEHSSGAAAGASNAGTAGNGKSEVYKPGDLARAALEIFEGKRQVEGM
jgi:hypothetical protein